MCGCSTTKALAVVLPIGNGEEKRSGWTAKVIFLLTDHNRAGPRFVIDFTLAGTITRVVYLELLAPPAGVYNTSEPFPPAVVAEVRAMSEVVLIITFPLVAEAISPKFVFVHQRHRFFQSVSSASVIVGNSQDSAPVTNFETEWLQEVCVAAGGVAVGPPAFAPVKIKRAHGLRLVAVASVVGVPVAAVARILLPTSTHPYVRPSPTGPVPKKFGTGRLMR